MTEPSLVNSMSVLNFSEGSECFVRNWAPRQVKFRRRRKLSFPARSFSSRFRQPFQGYRRRINDRPYYVCHGKLNQFKGETRGHVSPFSLKKKASGENPWCGRSGLSCSSDQGN